MPNLALFDFDGTITDADTFTPFVRESVSSFRLKLGFILLSPLVLLWKLRLLSSSTMRSAVVRVAFSGRSSSEVWRQGRAYAQTRLSKGLRPKALETIRWHLGQGDTVVVVSASLDVYLSDWCRQHGLELICSQLESNGDFLTGRYLSGDCTGVEKVRKVRERYQLESFELIYAYGDTLEDAPMLRLAHRRFYRWNEVHHSWG
jgi:HAD superfamily hydrolase (TIGR01490 family)